MSRNIFQWRSLNTKVTLFTLVVFVISMWSLAFYASRMLRENVQHLLGEQQFSTISLVAAQIDQNVDERLRALQEIAGSLGPEILGNAAAMQSNLEQRVVLQRLFNGGMLATRIDGTAIADVPVSAGRIGVNFSDRDFMVAAIKEGRATIGRPVMGKVQKAPVFSMAAPIRDKQGNVVGALVGVTNLGMPNFLNRIAENPYGKTGGYLVVSPQHRLIVTATDKRRIMEVLPANGVSPLIDRFIRGYEGSAVLMNPLGEQVLASAKGIPAAGWYAVAALPTAEAFDAFHVMRLRLLMATILVTVLVGGLTWWMLRRQIAPLISSVKTLAALSDPGQRAQPLPIVRQDEIGELIGGFNLLLETLSHRDEALRESEGRYRAIIEISPVPLAVNDASGNITFLNKAFVEVLGYTTNDLHTLEDWWPRAYPDTQYRQTVTEQWLRHLGEANGSGKPFVPMEVNIHCKDESIRTFMVSAAALTGHFAGNHFVIMYDITERKRAEASIRRLTRLYATLSQCNQAIVRCTSEAELFPQICRDAVTFGGMKMAWIGLVDETSQQVKPVAAYGEGSDDPGSLDISVNGNEPRGRGPTGTAVRENRPFWCQDYLNDPCTAPWHEHGAQAGWASSASLPLHRFGVVVGAISFYAAEANAFDEDIRKLLVEMAADIDFALDNYAREAGRKVADEALRDSEAQIGALINAIPDLIFTNSRSGEFLAVHASDPHLLLVPPENFLRRNIADILPKPIAEKFLKAFADAGRPDLIQEVNYTLAVGGQETHFEARVVPSSAGTVISIVRDVTAHKQNESARATLEMQLRESQKMQAIGTLAGGIAHDFNNILATILGNVDLARQDMGANPLALESLEEIRKAGGRARDLVQQILSFSRRESTQRKPTVLCPVVNESVRLLRATLPARLIIDVECDADVPPVMADATQIAQIVINLATNAMQAIRSGSGHIGIRLDTVLLDVSMAEAHPALRTLQTRYPGRTVRLAVSDDGPGMDAATRERIFEPFFTTKPVGEGTGLGLSVVHGIVQTHEGAIEVESQPGKGSTFTVYLPVAATTASEPASDEDKSKGTEIYTLVPDLIGKVRILYLDDDESLVFLVTRLLERRGYRVSGYMDQREALAALRAEPAAFDLVVTDYNMPDMSGLDVARAVRTIRADLPVAIASGFIDETLQTQAKGAGVQELIFKANAVEELCEAFARLAQAVGATVNPPH